MYNMVTGLSCKRSQLMARKHELQREYVAKVDEIDREIEKVNQALELLDEATKEFRCPNCDGTGEISYTDAAGGRDYKECPYCKGTGVKGVL